MTSDPAAGRRTALRRLLLLAAGLLGSRNLPADVFRSSSPTDPADLLDRLRQEDGGTAGVAALVVRAGRLFLGAPYRAGTLEGEGGERLRYTLGEFDCVTFVETALSLARCAERGERTTGAFEAELTRTRYRNGIIDGYASRLHYFRDWILANARRGAVEDVTAALGGSRRRKRISFMTAGARRYPALADPAVRKAIVAAERRLSDLPYHEIRARRIARVSERILPGDIIGITTGVRGLDVSHTGIALREDGVLRLLHAGTSGGGVGVSPGSLAAFVAAHPQAAGILVVRPRPSAG